MAFRNFSHAVATGHYKYFKLFYALPVYTHHVSSSWACGGRANGNDLANPNLFRGSGFTMDNHSFPKIWHAGRQETFLRIRSTFFPHLCYGNGGYDTGWDWNLASGLWSKLL